MRGDTGDKQAETKAVSPLDKLSSLWCNREASEPISSLLSKSTRLNFQFEIFNFQSNLKYFSFLMLETFTENFKLKILNLFYA